MHLGGKTVGSGSAGCGGSDAGSDAGYNNVITRGSSPGYAGSNARYNNITRGSSPGYAGSSRAERAR
eukprot:6943708-Pyramimonas_sp.AAC.1